MPMKPMVAMTPSAKATALLRDLPEKVERALDGGGILGLHHGEPPSLRALRGWIHTDDRARSAYR